MSRLLFVIETAEDGRRVVRQVASVDIPVGAWLRRLEVLTDDGLWLLSIPFSLDAFAGYDDDDLDDDDEDGPEVDDLGDDGQGVTVRRVTACLAGLQDAGGRDWACEKPRGHVGPHAYRLTPR